MKNGKNPPLAQKKLIAEHKLNPQNWLIVKNLPEEMHLMHRYTGRLRILKVRRAV